MSGQSFPSLDSWSRRTPALTVTRILKSVASPWCAAAAQSDLPIVSTLLAIGLPSESSIPALSHSALGKAHHQSRLVVKLAILRLDAHLRREVAGGLKPEEMAGITREAIMGLAPEIGRPIGGDGKSAAVEPPDGRLVQPCALCESHCL